MGLIMKLLISEPPLQVLPSLAVRIGLNEAIFLQQLHYWLPRSSTRINGRAWVYRTVKGWRVEFPFWSERTIQSVIYSLEQQGLIDVQQLSEDKRDKTNYYAINYDKLRDHDAEVAPSDHADSARSITQDLRDVYTRNTENTSETTTRDLAQPQAVAPRTNGATTGHGPLTNEGTTERQRTTLSAADLVKLGVPQQIAQDWISVRKAKHATALTQTALNTIAAEAEKAGITLIEAITVSAQQEWRGFRADWYRNLNGAAHANRVQSPARRLSPVERVRIANGMHPETGEFLDDIGCGAIDGQAVRLG